MTMLEDVKIRCGIPATITVYDQEFKELIADALEDMKTAGIPEDLLTDKGEQSNPRVLTAVSLYCKAMRGDDRSDTATYLDLYHRKVWKLMLEPDEEPDIDDEGV